MGDLVDLDAMRVARLSLAADGVQALVRIFQRETVKRLSAAVNDVGLDLAKEGNPTEAKLCCALSQMLDRFNTRRRR